jgi:ATP-dependent DNA helicase RecQ
MTNMLLDASRQVLQKTFGYQAFRPLQEQVLASVYEKKDTVVILPTGSGKSLCYQIPALVLGGVNFVISPLISLMKDQVDQLEDLGISATYINSSLTGAEINERFQEIENLQHRLVYVAPERLESPLFLQLLRSLAERRQVHFMAIDEAHCVSQWGHDFRPSYKRIKMLRDICPVPFLALTATATDRVREDLIKQLDLKDPQAFVGAFDRPNLHYATYQPDSKKSWILQYVKSKVDQSGIIYCATRKNVEETSDYLKENGVKVSAYHAGLGDEVRKKVQESFLKDRTPVIVATNAFGMGINKPNVRFVLHADMPGTMEHYTQEAGRAGRDGEPSECVLFFGYQDVVLQRFFIEGNNPSPKLLQEILLLLKSQENVRLNPRSLNFAKNQMEIDTALKLLLEAGAIKRVSNDEFDLSGQPYRLSFEELDAKRQLAELKLQVMIEYSESHDCKRNSIQAYFGYEPVTCANCSGCLQQEKNIRPKDAAMATDVTTPAQKILQGILSFPRAFGVSIAVAVLTGSKSQKMDEWKCASWKSYGSMREYTQAAVMKLVKDLVKSGYLERQGDEFPVLVVSERGRKTLEGQEQVLMHAAEEPSFIERSTATAAMDQVLFETLRQWRREEAQKKDVPPFVIFGDRTLREISQSFPQTKAQLLNVNGMGDRKYEQYGAALLKIITEHSSKYNRSFQAVQSADAAPKMTKKVQKGQTQMETWDFLQQGLKLPQIAMKRGLALTTIESHVADLIESGYIKDISAFVSEGRQRQIREVAQKGGQHIKALKEALPSEISYGEIRIVLAGMRG